MDHGHLSLENLSRGIFIFGWIKNNLRMYPKVECRMIVTAVDGCILPLLSRGGILIVVMSWFFSIFKVSKSRVLTVSLMDFGLKNCPNWDKCSDYFPDKVPKSFSSDILFVTLANRYFVAFVRKCLIYFCKDCRTKYFVGHTFRHQANISSLLYD